MTDPLASRAEDDMPTDDEVTTIRWGRLRQLFDAEAEVIALRAEVARLRQEKNDDD